MKQLILGLVALTVVVLTPGPASAGGWAVTTLDSVPEAAAGQTVDIGFTIRQHGVTPVNPDGEVGIVFRSTAGEEQFHAAEPMGDVGHYRAEVTFPDVGTWLWAVRQGWFAEQTLGIVELAPRSGSSVAGDYRWPVWARLGLPALALVFAAGAVLDVTRDRGRRHRVPAA
ncbi:MAG: hypothetical protein WBM50_20565 [Acidimicrobiales bacterium]